jgi:hypothetical protein
VHISSYKSFYFVIISAHFVVVQFVALKISRHCCASRLAPVDTHRTYDTDEVGKIGITPANVQVGSCLLLNVWLIDELYVSCPHRCLVSDGCRASAQLRRLEARGRTFESITLQRCPHPTSSFDSAELDD